MFENQHAKVIRLEVSVGKNDADRTLDELLDAVRAALKAAPVAAHNITVQGSYYIIDGKVCLPDDYDHDQRDRKPGTYPPTWAGGPTVQEKAAATFVEDKPREFVPVQADPHKRRDPITGVKPRKPRSDKGVKKGPRVPLSKAS